MCRGYWNISTEVACIHCAWASSAGEDNSSERWTEVDRTGYYYFFSFWNFGRTSLPDLCWNKSFTSEDIFTTNSPPSCSGLASEHSQREWERILGRAPQRHSLPDPALQNAPILCDCVTAFNLATALHAERHEKASTVLWGTRSSCPSLCETGCPFFSCAWAVERLARPTQHQTGARTHAWPSGSGSDESRTPIPLARAQVPPHNSTCSTQGGEVPGQRESDDTWRVQCKRTPMRPTLSDSERVFPASPPPLKLRYPSRWGAESSNLMVPFSREPRGAQSRSRVSSLTRSTQQSQGIHWRSERP